VNAVVELLVSTFENGSQNKRIDDKECHQYQFPDKEGTFLEMCIAVRLSSVVIAILGYVSLVFLVPSGWETLCLYIGLALCVRNHNTDTIAEYCNQHDNAVLPLITWCVRKEVS